jgi:hypothetical protein
LLWMGRKRPLKTLLVLPLVRAQAPPGPALHLLRYVESLPARGRQGRSAPATEAKSSTPTLSSPSSPASVGCGSNETADSARTAPSKSPPLTTLGAYPSRTSPTDSAEEPSCREVIPRDQDDLREDPEAAGGPAQRRGAAAEDQSIGDREGGARGTPAVPVQPSACTLISPSRRGTRAG